MKSSDILKKKHVQMYTYLQMHMDKESARHISVGYYM